MPLLNELLPRWHFRERHVRAVAAPPERVWDAIHEVTLGEMPLARLLFRLRGMSQAADRPLLEQMLAGGYAWLGEVPGRELAAGVVARMWRPGGDVQPISGGPEFAAFERPGFAKAAMDFRLLAGEDGGTRLETETRILATDAAARRAFGRYWLVVRPGSGLIRRVWLRAVARRAEAPPVI